MFAFILYQEDMFAFILYLCIVVYGSVVGCYGD